MPICIECSYPVSNLFTVYSKADDHSLGDGVSLTKCPCCKRVADKYVEHDFVMLFIDLILMKPQVYRHLLFNRLTPASLSGFHPSINKLAILLLLFDAYLIWARIEKTWTSSMSPLMNRSIIEQYIFFLTLSTVSTLLHHISVRLLVRVLLPSDATTSEDRGNRISAALLISSFAKFFTIVTMIWDYDVPIAAMWLGWAVLLNNVVALTSVLGCGALRASILASAGAFIRWCVGEIMLGAMGLGKESGPVADLISLFSLAING
ncbi:MAG: sterol homeostasis protein [Cirrosporium novae-zelandiae]|nr:MAG: sterol homeostasis protein [Cirrosporium novae-zelandiae]